TQLPVQLALADIDGVDLRRAVLQQYVGEAAGGGTHIDADAPLHRETEMLQAMGQLDAAAADPGMRLAAHFKLRIGADRMARLVEALLARKHQAGHDGGLGLGPAFRQPALHQRLIEPHLLSLHACRSCMRRSLRAQKAKRQTSSTAETARPTTSPIQTPSPRRGV